MASEADLTAAAANFMREAARYSAAARDPEDPLDGVSFRVPDLGGLDPVVTDEDASAVIARMGAAKAPAEAIPALVTMARSLATFFGLA